MAALPLSWRPGGGARGGVIGAPWLLSPYPGGLAEVQGWCDRCSMAALPLSWRPGGGARGGVIGAPWLLSPYPGGLAEVQGWCDRCSMAALPMLEAWRRCKGGVIGAP